MGLSLRKKGFKRVEETEIVKGLERVMNPFRSKNSSISPSLIRILPENHNRSL